MDNLTSLMRVVVKNLIAILKVTNQELTFETASDLVMKHLENLISEA